MTAQRLRELTTFVGVGMAATATHLIVAWLAHAIGLSPHPANLTGWLAAVVVSFLGQARLTFRVEGALGPYLPRFLTFSGLAFLISAGVVTVTTGLGLPFWTGLVGIGILAPAASYLVQRHLVFAEPVTRFDPGQIFAVVTGLLIFAGFREAYVNHDVAWYLIAGRQWIDGAQLYTDLSEVNPPLAFYLMRAALHFGDILSLGPAASLAAFIGFLTTLVMLWVTRLTPRETPYRLVFLGIVALATTLPFLKHFGQREHVMVLLILPWAVAAMFRTAPHTGRGAVLRGLVAGIGICLKPHFLVFPAALALYDCAREQSLRPLFRASHMAMGAVGVAYVAGVAILHPEYFSIIVPDAQLVYGAYTLPLKYAVQNLWPVPVAMIAVVLALGWRSAGDGGARAALLFLAGLGAYVLQGNGFAYHAAPAHALGVIALARVATVAPPAKALAALAVIGFMVQGLVSFGGYRNPLSTPLERILTEEGLQPSRLLVWSPSLLPAFPLVLETGAEWTGHAASLWLLPGTLDMVEAGAPPDDPRWPVLERSRIQMSRDLARCPDVLIIDRALPFRTAPLDIPAYGGPDIEKEVSAAYSLAVRDSRFDILTRNRPCP